MWKKIMALLCCAVVLMSCIVLPTSAKVSTQDPSYYDYDNGFLVITGNKSTHYSTLNTALANLANNAILIFYEDVRITDPLSISLGDYENVNIKGNKHKIIHTHNFVNHSVSTDNHFAVSFSNCRKNYYIDNLTIISNTGGITIESSGTSSNRAIFDNVKIYAGYSYGLIDPNFYNFDVTELKAGLKTNIAERTIQTFVGMRIKQSNTYVEIHNSSIIRTMYGMALRQDSNSYTYVYNGYFRTEGTAYTFSNGNGDGCVIMVADGGKLSMYNGVVDARFVANDNGSDSARWDELATAAIRVYGSGELYISGGIYYSTGSVIHTHYKATNSKVSINGGTFIAVDDPDYDTEYNHLFRFLQGSIKISDGFFVTQRPMRQMIINHQASIDLIAGTYLAEAAKAEQLQMLIGKVDTNGSQAGTLEMGIIKDENNSLVFGEDDLYYNLTDAYLSYMNAQYNVLATQLGYTNSTGSGSYDKGYQDGLAFGYDSGYTVGMTDGYANGYDFGYNVGALDGFAQGIEQGKQIGYEQGYQTGKQETAAEEYNKGYLAGAEATAKEIETKLENVFRFAKLNIQVHDAAAGPEMPLLLELADVPFTIESWLNNKEKDYITFQSTSDYITAALRTKYGQGFVMSKVGSITCTFVWEADSTWDFNSGKMYIDPLFSSRLFDMQIKTLDQDNVEKTAKIKIGNETGLYGYKALTYASTSNQTTNSAPVKELSFTVDEGLMISTFTVYCNAKVLSKGYQMGYADGLISGVNTSQEGVYDMGKKEGEKQGYIKGKQEGLAIAEKGNWTNLFTAVVEAPITAMHGLFDFEILGLNMKAMVGSLLVLCIVLIVIKTFLL